MENKTSENKFKLSDLTNLELIRGELQLQAHLFKEDVKADWEKVEKEWNHLNSEVQHVKATAKDSMKEVSAATSLLFQAVHDGYVKIKDSIK
ncbi:MAG: hypothetical protein ABIQ95_13050 [Bdellovibrionia bacterium]